MIQIVFRPSGSQGLHRLAHACSVSLAPIKLDQVQVKMRRAPIRDNIYLAIFQFLQDTICYGCLVHGTKHHPYLSVCYSVCKGYDAQHMHPLSAWHLSDWIPPDSLIHPCHVSSISLPHANHIPAANSHVPLSSLLSPATSVTSLSQAPRALVRFMSHPSMTPATLLIGSCHLPILPPPCHC